MQEVFICYLVNITKVEINKTLKKLEELSHDSFYNMQNYSQITIDFIQELEETLSVNYLWKQELENDLKALSYKMSTVLDVLNPELKTDKEALLNLVEIIENV